MSDSNTSPLWLQVPEPCDLVRKFGTAVDVPAFGGRLEVDWSTMARLIAIVADWWNVFCRLADPTAHREAITSRPAYMGIMGRIVESGRKRIIHLTSTHADSEMIQRAPRYRFLP